MSPRRRGAWPGARDSSIAKRFERRYHDYPIRKGGGGLPASGGVGGDTGIDRRPKASVFPRTDDCWEADREGNSTCIVGGPAPQVDHERPVLQRRREAEQEFGEFMFDESRYTRIALARTQHDLKTCVDDGLSA